MTQTEALLELFRMNGNRLTASQIWENWRLVGRKYTSRLSDLRMEVEKTGGSIDCFVNKSDPKNNLYVLNEFNGAGKAQRTPTDKTEVLVAASCKERSSLPTPAPLFEKESSGQIVWRVA